MSHFKTPSGENWWGMMSHTEPLQSIITERNHWHRLSSLSRSLLNQKKPNTEVHVKLAIVSGVARLRGPWGDAIFQTSDLVKRVIPEESIACDSGKHETNFNSLSEKEDRSVEVDIIPLHK